MLQFGEKMHFRLVGRERASGLAARMQEGRYVGHHPRSGALLAMTEEGVVKAKAFCRMTERERWDLEGMDKLCGVPWQMKNRQPRAPRPLVLGAEEGGPSLPLGPVPAAAPQERRRYVLRGDIEKHGKTEGCPGCASIGTGRSVTHSDACRDRIGEILMREIEGQERIARWRNRRAGARAEAAEDDAAPGEEVQAADGAGAPMPQDEQGDTRAPTTPRMVVPGAPRSPDGRSDKRRLVDIPPGSAERKRRSGQSPPPSHDTHGRRVGNKDQSQRSSTTTGSESYGCQSRAITGSIGFRRNVGSCSTYAACRRPSWPKRTRPAATKRGGQFEHRHGRQQQRVPFRGQFGAGCEEGV